MPQINLHVYFSNFKHETRIFKETKSLIKIAELQKIILIGIWEKGLVEYESLDHKRAIWRVPLKTRVLPSAAFWKVIKYLEWLIKIFLRFRKKEIAVINCHSLNVLPLGLLFKVFTQTKIIYDTHELETEAAGLSPLRKVLAKIIEKILIKRANQLIVVSESIGQWYQKRYHLKNVLVIKNFPEIPARKIQSSRLLKEKFKIKDSEILFIYQGLLDRGRGIKILLEVFSKLKDNKHLVFMGYGPLESLIQKYAKLFSNIHFQTAVKPEEILRYTASADVGLSLAENVCLSYYYSLPNRLFEYLVSGLAVIVSNFPDMARVIAKNQCGWQIAPTRQALLKFIRKLSNKEISKKRNNVLKCGLNFVWENEEKKLLNIYENLLKHNNGIKKTKRDCPL